MKINKALKISVVTVLVSIFTFILCTGTRVFLVTTGSMDPVVPPYSLIVTLLMHTDIEPGKVIVFTEENSGKVVAHRLISGGTELITKGDQNSFPDKGDLSMKQVIGEVLTVIPLLSTWNILLQLGFLVLSLVSGVLLRKFLLFLLRYEN